MAAAATPKTIGIIGTGPGGLRLAAHLGLAGHRLRLNDIDDAKLSALRASGGVHVEHLDGSPWGFAKVERATTNLRETVAGADIIIVVSGGNTHPAVARALASLLEDGQLVLLIQGNTGGSLIVRRELDRAGCRADVTLAEMDCYPYAMRRPEPMRFRHTTQKRWLQIAAFPASRTAEALDRLKPLFPHAVGAYVANRAAATLDHKYITEDVPTGLMPISALGAAAGVKTPAIDALVSVVQHMLGRSFEAEARTLERLGLAGLDSRGIVRTVSVGFA